MGEPRERFNKLIRYEHQEQTNSGLPDLINTTLITYDQFVSFYKYISVCEHAQPVLCDTKYALSHEIVYIRGVPAISKTIHVELGKDYELSCHASGAPYLKAEWIFSNLQGDFYYPKSVDTYDSSAADHAIKSTVKLSNFTVDNIGSFLCSIKNINFMPLKVHKSYELTYRNEVKVISKPSIDYFTKTEEFSWVLSGWPLEVDIQCTGGTTSQQPDFYRTDQPTLTLTLITPPNNSNISFISCKLKKSKYDWSPEYFYFTKVGYNCSAGEYGVNNTCPTCPTGGC